MAGVEQEPKTNKPWFKAQGFTEQDSQLLSDQGIGPNITKEMKKTYHDLNLTRGGRKLLERIISRTEPDAPTNIQEPSVNTSQTENKDQLPLALTSSQTTGSHSVLNSLKSHSNKSQFNSGHAKEQNIRHRQTKRDNSIQEKFLDRQESETTIEELRISTHAHDDDMNRVCHSTHLDEIALEFRNIRELGDSLGLKEHELADIEHNMPGTSYGYKLKQVLKLWKRKNGHKATYKRLAQVCLQSLERMDVATLVCELSKVEVEDENNDADDLKDRGKNVPWLKYGIVVIFVSFIIITGVGFIIYLSSSSAKSNPHQATTSTTIRVVSVDNPSTSHETVIHSANNPPTSHDTATPTPTPEPEMPPYSGPLTGTVIRKRERPTMTQLRSFTLRTGKKIDFVNELAPDYKKFGVLLLKSETEVRILEMSNHHQPKDIAYEILRDWLTGKGVLPVTWKTLIDVIEKSDLNLLAYDVKGQLADRDEL